MKRRTVVEGDNRNAKGKAKGGKSKDDSDDAQLKSALKNTIIQEKPNVHWEDIAGLEEAKKMLQEALILPKQYEFLFNDNTPAWKGILMYGPPGTGKTFVAKACATETDCQFFSVSSADLMSKF